MMTCGHLILMQASGGKITIENPSDAPPTRYGGHFGALYGDTDTLWIGSGFTLTTALPSRYIDTYKLIFTSRTTARWEELFGEPSRGNQFNPLQPHGRCLQGSAVVEPEKLVMFGGCMRYTDIMVYMHSCTMYSFA